MFLFYSLVNLVFFITVANAAPEATDLKVSLPVIKYQLDNGLTVILHEDHSVPLISYHTWYRVGSRNESEGVTGAAHMLEHMMFQGSKNYPGKAYEKLLHENGITNNAFTTNDYTGFYQDLPSSKLELIMDAEVDRMANLSINAETLKSELQVVGEERRWRVDNNPMGMLHEELMATLYKVHPYKWPVIGYMSDIQAYTSEKLRYFHDNFYVPNNAVLVIAGDFNTEEVKKMIKANYGPLKSKPLPVLSINPEPEQSEPTTVVKKADVQATTFLVAYHGVESGHPDSYALDLLASILGNGNSSRLYKKLVYDKQEAMNSFAFNDTNKDPGYFAVGSSLKPKNSYKKSLHLIYSEIEKVRTQLISKKELDKVKNQVMKNFVDELTTIHEKAEALAVNEIVAGSYEQLFKDLELYKKVTPEEIKKVALKYLNQNQRSVVVLEPK